jgi:hypothetical protein
LIAAGRRALAYQTADERLRYVTGFDSAVKEMGGSDMLVVMILAVGFGSWALGWVLDHAGDEIDGNGFLHYVGLGLKVLGFVIGTAGVGIALDAARHPERYVH